MSKKSFSYVWDTFENEIKEGRLISSSEIYDELKDKDLAQWAKKNKHAFQPLSQEIQEVTRDILKKYPAIK